MTPSWTTEADAEDAEGRITAAYEPNLDGNATIKQTNEP